MYRENFLSRYTLVRGLDSYIQPVSLDRQHFDLLIASVYNIYERFHQCRDATLQILSRAGRHFRTRSGDPWFDHSESHLKIAILC
jgi:hypothetical protein